MAQWNRVTDADIATMVGAVNDVLPNHKIHVRRHYYNSNQCLEYVDANGNPTNEPFFVGNKREVYTYLRAMIRMHYLLTGE